MFHHGDNKERREEERKEDKKEGGFFGSIGDKVRMTVVSRTETLTRVFATSQLNEMAGGGAAGEAKEDKLDKSECSQSP